MKVYINGRFLSRRMTGVDRFAFEILRQLDLILAESEDSNVYEILMPQGCSAPDFVHLKSRTVGGAPGHFWEQWHLYRAAQDGLLINLCNTGPLFKRDQVLVFHDATTKRVPNAFKFSFRLWYWFLIKITSIFSFKIATVSEFSRREISLAFGLDYEKLVVLPEGAEHINRFASDESVLANPSISGKPFFLAVSSTATHKNFGLILAALEREKELPFNVVIAGGSDPKVFGDGGVTAHPNLIWLGYVSNEQLKALYCAAKGFIFPSLYEGFGLPPLEAMACGCPAIVANAASMPEVCGDAVLYIDPLSADDLRDAMWKLFNSPELCRQLRATGINHAKSWSWRTAALELLKLVNSHRLHH